MAINGTFGTHTYIENRIEIPVALSVSAFALRRGNFRITTVAGDALTSAEIYLQGSGTAWTLVIEVLIGLAGAFVVEGVGKAIRSSNITEETVSVPRKLVTFSMLEPVFDLTVPRVLRPGINDFIYTWQTLVTRLDVRKIKPAGIDPGTTVVYRAASLTTLPAVTPVIDTNDWKIISTPHTEAAKYHLFRFNVAASQLPGGLDVIFEEGAVVSDPTAFEFSPVILGDAAVTGTEGVPFSTDYYIYSTETFTTPTVSGLPAGATSAWTAASGLLRISWTAAAAVNGNFTITAGTTTKSFSYRIEASGGGAVGLGAVGQVTQLTIGDIYGDALNSLLINTDIESFLPIYVPVTGLGTPTQQNLNASNTSPHGAAFVDRSDKQEVHIINNGDDNVYVYDPTSYAYEKRYSLLSGNTQPRGVTYVPSVDEFWCVDNNAPRKIYRMDPDDGTSAGNAYTLNSSNTSPESLFYVPTLDEVHCVNRNDRKVYRYNPHTGAEITPTFTLPAAATNVRSAAWCPINGEIFALDSSSKSVYRLSDAYAELGTFALDTAHSTTITGAVVVDGKLWAIDNGQDKNFVYALTRTDPNRVLLKGRLHQQFAYDYQPKKGRMRIFGRPNAFINGLWFAEVYQFASDTTPTRRKELAWKVVSNDIVITLIQNLKLYRGVPINFLVPISNQPSVANAEGLQIGVEFEKVDAIPHAGVKIFGQLPAAADANFTVTTEDFIIRAAGHTAQTYLENSQSHVGVKATQAYEILTGTPPTMSFTATAGFRKVDLSWTAVTGALLYEYQIGDGEWKSAGTGTTYTIPDLTIGTAVSIKMRVGSPWIGTATAAQTVTPNTYVTLGGGLSASTGGVCLYDGKIAVLDRTPYDIFFFNKATFAYDSKLILRKLLVNGYSVSPDSSRLDYGGNHFFVIAKLPGNNTSKLLKYANSGNNINPVREINLLNNSNQTMEGICYFLQGGANYNFIVVKSSGDLRFYLHVDSNNSIGSAISESFNNASSGILCRIANPNSYHLFRAGKLEGYTHQGGTWTHSPANDVQLNPGFSSLTQSQVQGICYDDDADVFYLLSGNRLYIQENLLGS